MRDDPGPPYRIMVVEDNDADVELLRESLDAVGLSYFLTTFSDGEEAIAYFRGQAEQEDVPRPHLILLDLNLPKLDGCAVLAAIRETESHTRTPVAVMSSSVSSKDRERMMKLEVDRHIVKPLDLDDFLKIGAVVKDLLENTTAREGGMA